jgi:hypothetical protein
MPEIESRQAAKDQQRKCGNRTTHVQEQGCEQGGRQSRNGEGKQVQTRAENVLEMYRDCMPFPGTIVPGQCDSFAKLWKCLVSEQDIALLASDDVKAGSQELAANPGFGGVGAGLEDNTC